MRFLRSDLLECRLRGISGAKSGLAVRSGGDFPQTATSELNLYHTFESELVQVQASSRRESETILLVDSVLYLNILLVPFFKEGKLGQERRWIFIVRFDREVMDVR